MKDLWVVLFIAIPCWVATAWWIWWTRRLHLKQEAKEKDIERGLAEEAMERHPPQQRQSVKCAPERIRPTVKRGGCGVPGCPIKWSHSHVEDLARRLKEMKK